MEPLSNEDDSALMTKERLRIRRSPVRVLPDPKRVIARPFFPGGEIRARTVVDRVMALPDDEVKRLLDETLRDFHHRHREIEWILADNYRAAAHLVDGQALSDERKLLIGAYFTSEYSLESIALFNPSLVAHPDQSGVAPGELRFVMSLRACGEGHVSSIEFRSGTLGADNSVRQGRA